MILSKISRPRGWKLETYLADQKKRVEQRLTSLPLADGKPTRAREAMVYSLATPGKRFRPLLTIATADVYRQGHQPVVLDAAVAVECVHTASLIFDDLPCMDDAQLRRGRKPTHLLYGEDQAVLAGLSLIAEANRLISSHARERGGRLKKLECLDLLNASYSIEGLSGGQSDDLLNKVSLTIEELEYIHAKKTGALFIAAVELGAVLGDATAGERQWLKAFAKNLGLAFQIQDDLLDRVDSATTGKDSHKDANKTTFVSILGEEQCRQLYNELIEVALQNLVPFGDSAFHLREITERIRVRDH